MMTAQKRTAFTARLTHLQSTAATQEQSDMIDHFTSLLDVLESEDDYRENINIFETALSHFEIKFSDYCAA